MIEISLAIAAASQAVSTIKKGLRAGRDAQDLASQFANFFDAKDKIDGAKAESEHAPLGSKVFAKQSVESYACLLYTSPSPRDATLSRMPSSA